MQTAIGYIFNSNGSYDKKWYFEMTYKNIASFIYINSDYEVIITDIADESICTGSYGFLDRMGDRYGYDLQNILNELLQLQSGGSPSTFNFKEAEQGVMKDGRL